MNLVPQPDDVREHRVEVLQLGAVLLEVARAGPLVSQARGTPFVVRMSLVGAAPKPLVSGLDELPGKANYLFAIRPRVPGSQPRPGSIPARSTAQRPETRRKPRAFRGTDAKEFPILSRWRPTMPPTC